MRYPMILALCAIVASLAGCGGGGGSSSSNTSASPTVSAQNALPVTVEFGPGYNVNMPYVSVKVCTPGTSNCQTIDHVLVDTGSNGLRLFASELSAGLSLPQQTAASGDPLGECMPFIDGVTWGAIKVADVQLAGLTATSVNIQVVGDSAFQAPPAGCVPNNDPELNLDSAAKFRAKGVLGVGLFTEDCGAWCAQTTNNTLYYACTSSGCTQTKVDTAKQAQNPVSRFPNDNNGVVVKLPSVPASGAPRAVGELVFGIGTQKNNDLGSASGNVFPANPFSGYITTVYNNRTYSESFIDSGSNGIFFADSIPQCKSGFYCPASTLNFSATNVRTTGTNSRIAFTVANADQLFSSNNYTYAAFSTLAGSMGDPDKFDWGLPFFFGRNVFTAIEGKSTPAGNGPYFAY